MKRDLVAENWRLERSRYALIGSHCVDCNKYYFPQQQMCILCNGDQLDEHIYSGNGKLVEWTRIHDVASGFEMYNPLFYGIIELEEGNRIPAQLTGVFDESKLAPGVETTMVFRRLYEDGHQGVITYGFKAQPQV